MGTPRVSARSWQCEGKLRKNWGVKNSWQDLQAGCPKSQDSSSCSLKDECRTLCSSRADTSASTATYFVEEGHIVLQGYINFGHNLVKESLFARLLRMYKDNADPLLKDCQSYLDFWSARTTSFLFQPPWQQSPIFNYSLTKRINKAWHEQWCMYQVFKRKGIWSWRDGIGIRYSPGPHWFSGQTL